MHQCSLDFMSSATTSLTFAVWNTSSMSGYIILELVFHDPHPSSSAIVRLNS